jgi:DNA repair protein RadC
MSRKLSVVRDQIASYGSDSAVIQAALDILRDRMARCSDVLGTPNNVRAYLSLNLAPREQEVFWAVWLDSQNRVLAAEELFRGTLTQTSVYPREVVKRALAMNAANVLFAHNHPSGLAEPSHADEMLTRMLQDALKLVDVRVLDHFIVAGTQVMSFAERGIL